MKMKIGADELILWIRKNGIANDTPNDEIHGLGVKICRIVEKLGGTKLNDVPSFWPIVVHGNIGKYKLPETSTQYEIDINILPQIYQELRNCNK